VFSLPVLKPKKSSFACSNVLRNPPAFPTLASFDADYALLPDSISVDRVFRARATALERIEHTLFQQSYGSQPSPGNVINAEGSQFSFEDYYGWQLTGRKIDADLKSLRDRPTMEKWSYAFFMKLCYPPIRATWQDPMLVGYPLNLTMFFRLISTIHGHGYPAHWLADVLSSILNNQVHTTARPPRSYPYKIKELKKDFANKHIDLSPFIAELRTLTTLWLPELPFGLMLPSALPNLSKVRKYSVHFTQTTWKGDTNQAVFNLMFSKLEYFHTIMAGAPSYPESTNLRSALLFDEKKDTSFRAEDLRKNCTIISTWTWNMEKKRGTFWIDEDVIEKMLKEGDWYVTILRQDSWQLCAKPESLAKLDTGIYWVEQE
jgi:hypothetical protein